MRKIYRDVASAVILSKDKILLGRQKENTGIYQDCWHIPGGRQEEGETVEEALKREVMEETGIDISCYKSILLDDSQIKEVERILEESSEKVLCTMHFYDFKVVIADKTSDEIITNPSDDLTNLHWFSVSELATLKLTPPLTQLFKKTGYLK